MTEPNEPRSDIKFSDARSLASDSGEEERDARERGPSPEREVPSPVGHSASGELEAAEAAEVGLTNAFAFGVPFFFSLLFGEDAPALTLVFGDDGVLGLEPDLLGLGEAERGPDLVATGDRGGRVTFVPTILTPTPLWYEGRRERRPERTHRGPLDLKAVQKTCAPRNGETWTGLGRRRRWACRARVGSPGTPAQRVIQG